MKPGIVAMLVVLATLAGACALFAADPPDDACDGDEDCFRAQGEVCNLDRGRCEQGPDAGVAIDAPVD